MKKYFVCVLIFFVFAFYACGNETIEEKARSIKYHMPLTEVVEIMGEPDSMGSGIPFYMWKISDEKELRVLYSVGDGFLVYEAVIVSYTDGVPSYELLFCRPDVPPFYS